MSSDPSLKKQAFRIYILWAYWLVMLVLLALIRFSIPYFNEQFVLCTCGLVLLTCLQGELEQREQQRNTKPATPPRPVVTVVRRPEPPLPPVRRRSVNRNGYVYLLRGPDGLYKIGQTRNPDDRLRTFEVRLPFDVEYQHVIECRDRFAIERYFHDYFSTKRIRGEWFALDESDVEYMKAFTKV